MGLEMQPQNRYKKGARLERELMKHLEQFNPIYKTRSAGSHSFFDVIAVFDDRVDFYQVKSQKTKMEPFLKSKMSKKRIFWNEFVCWKEKGKWHLKRLE